MFCILALPLNLNLIEILLHMVTLVVLIVAIRLFLYKKIVQFMNERKEEFIKKDNELEQNLVESNLLKEKYETLLTETKQNVVLVTESTLKKAQVRANEIIDEAKDKASDIINAANKEIEQKTKEEMNNMKNRLSEVASGIALEILKREINESDINNQIDIITREWKNN